MVTVELKFPYVVNEDGQTVGYGGNQDWYPLNWQRRAGCCATNAANMAAFYGLFRPGMEAMYTGSRERIGQKEYLTLMEDMYRRMTPGVMGYPYLAKAGKRFVEYAAERGIFLKPVAHCHWQHWREAFSVIQQAIDADRPVGMLILFHRAEELKDDIWHWITVTGYTVPTEPGEKPMVIVSDCGQRGLCQADRILEVHRKNMVKLLEFVEE